MIAPMYVLASLRRLREDEGRDSRGVTASGLELARWTVLLATDALVRLAALRLRGCVLHSERPRLVLMGETADKRCH